MDDEHTTEHDIVTTGAAPAGPPGDAGSSRSGVPAPQVAIISLLAAIVALIIGYGLGFAVGSDDTSERASIQQRSSQRAGEPRDGEEWNRSESRGGPGAFGPRGADRDELREWFEDIIDVERFEQWFDEELRPEFRRWVDRLERELAPHQDEDTDPPATTAPSTTAPPADQPD